MQKVDKNMKIEEVLKNHPKTVTVFAKHGFQCIGCAAASFESIEQGAMAHGVDVEELMKDLNRAIK